MKGFAKYLATGVTLLAAAWLATSCSEHHKKALLGEWVRTETQRVTEDDGSRSEVKSVTSLYFKEKKLTMMQRLYIDGESCLDISVTGTWDYESHSFIGSDAIGVISVTWDPTTLDSAYDTDYGLDVPHVMQTWEEWIDHWNDETEKAKRKSSRHSKVDFYWGYYLIAVDDDRLVLEEEGETFTYTKDR